VAAPLGAKQDPGSNSHTPARALIAARARQLILGTYELTVPRQAKKASGVPR